MNLHLLIQRLLRPGTLWTMAFICINLTPQANAQPSKAEQPAIWMETHSAGQGYEEGPAYLIPKSFDELKAALQTKSKWFRGFKEDIARSQSLREYEWDSTWTPVYYQYHEKEYEDAKRESLHKLDKALASRTITKREHRARSAAIRNGAAQELDRMPPIVSMDQVRRTEFLRSTNGATGIKRSEFYIDEYVVLLEVAALLNDRAPLTLLWHGGRKTTRVRTSFELWGCMTGVTCFPQPHWATTTKEENFLNPDLSAGLGDLARRLSARPPEQLIRLRKAMEWDQAVREPVERKAR